MSLFEILFRFCVYGVLGWSGEILWTAITRRVRGKVQNWILMGETSLWAFPMYGSAVFLFEPVHNLLRSQYFITRGILYLIGFWLIEFLGGWLVWKITQVKPWDYSESKYSGPYGLIRWNFALIWFAVGMGAETLHDFLIRIGPLILKP